MEGAGRPLLVTRCPVSLVPVAGRHPREGHRPRAPAVHGCVRGQRQRGRIVRQVRLQQAPVPQKERRVSLVDGPLVCDVRPIILPSHFSLGRSTKHMSPAVSSQAESTTSCDDQYVTRRESSCLARCVFDGPAMRNFLRSSSSMSLCTFVPRGGVHHPLAVNGHDNTALPKSV